MRAAGVLMAMLAATAGAEIRVGIIGTDTSHVPAFTKSLNDKSAPDYVPGARVVAAYKGGSPDMPASANRVDKFAEEIRTKYGVEIVPDIATLLSRVDAVLLESVDGRAHLAQAREVIAAGKPLFIDKPLAGSLEDARAIAALAKRAGVAWFSTSSLRYADFLPPLKTPVPEGAVTWGPGPLDSLLDLELAWYAIHPIEMLYALMGPGCVEVSRTTAESGDVITGRWKDGRLGTVRAVRPGSGYGAVVFRDGKAVQSESRGGPGYVALVREIVKFFETKVPPVSNEETLEIFAFMEAAQRSKTAGGRPVQVRVER
ncbi:MAG: Gfo/Idh/MocA family protein [Bryobacteraceae bacterium]